MKILNYWRGKMTKKDNLKLAILKIKQLEQKIKAKKGA